MTVAITAALYARCSGAQPCKLAAAAIPRNTSSLTAGTERWRRTSSSVISVIGSVSLIAGIGCQRLSPASRFRPALMTPNFLHVLRRVFLPLTQFAIQPGAEVVIQMTLKTGRQIRPLAAGAEVSKRGALQVRVMLWQSFIDD